jgi:hypothetical protein
LANGSLYIAKKIAAEYDYKVDDAEYMYCLLGLVIAYMFFGQPQSVT